jgi:hypothetical protein
MSLNQQTLQKEVQQFVALKDEINLLTNRQKEIKERLVATLKEYGEVDGRGHIVLDVNDPITGTEKITHQRKVSKSLDMDVAEKILGEKNLKEQCIKMVPVLDEAEIMASFYRGELTEEDIDSMFPSKVSYAFVV